MRDAPPYEGVCPVFCLCAGGQGRICDTSDFITFVP